MRFFSVVRYIINKNSFSRFSTVISNDAVEKYKKTLARPVQLIVNRYYMNQFDSHQNNYTPTEIQLAHEIAERLDDPASLTQFLKYAREVPHEYLRRELNKACSIAPHKIISSRAAIFVNSVKNYKLTHGYSRD